MRPQKTQLNSAIQQLPQKPNTWYLAVRTYPDIHHNEPLYFYIILDKNSNQVMEGDFLPQAPKTKKLLTTLERLMFLAKEAELPTPHRPMLIEFEQQAVWETLEPHLTKAGIASRCHPQPKIVDSFIEQAMALMEEEENNQLDFLDSPGMTPQLAGEFFSAAAALYQSDPWVVLDATRPVKLTFDPSGETCYVFFIGHAEAQNGIMIFNRWEEVLAISEQGEQSSDQIPEGEVLAINFEPRISIANGVVKAIDKHGWEIAGEQAYPQPIIYAQNDFLRPDVNQLTRQTLVMQTISLFIREHLQTDENEDEPSVQTEYHIENSQGSTKIQVCYPAPQIQAAMAARDYGLVEAGEGHVETGLNLAEQAWDTEDSLERVRLAQEALAIWPDCIDAYLVLGEEAESVEEALQFFQQGVKAAERALDHQKIERYVGRLWDLHMARAHLNARQGMLECLVENEDYKKANLAAEQLLEMNPIDHQGIRYTQLYILTQLQDEKALRQLLDNYPEEMVCSWPYSRALLEFRQKGDSRKTRMLLQEALERNPYVPEYLTGKKLIPDELPDYESFGDETEAANYASDYFNTWWQTKGAMDWLRRNITYAPEE